MRIIAGSEVSEAERASLAARFPAVTLTASAGAGEAGADAYLGRISPEVYHANQRTLRWVHSMGAGIETISAIPELVASDVVVTNTRGAHAPFIAEHAFAMLLALNRQLLAFAEDQRQHVWKRPGVAEGMRELYGRTMVVVGMGNIGRAIASRAAAFGMTVIGVDRAPAAADDGTTIRPITELGAALAEADAVMVTVPSTPETANLLDTAMIDRLPDRAVVIVVSRGGIVDEQAVAARLRAGTLAGAGFDVFADEPLPADSALWETPHLLITPHCSGGSSQTRHRVMEITAENIRRFLAGEPLLNVCDKQAGF